MREEKHGRDLEVERFYTTRKWRACRTAYAASVNNLCERCLRNGIITPGDQVHHKKRLNAKTVNDPAVALGWSNLELLCEECHQNEHRPQRWRTDEEGRVLL